MRHLIVILVALVLLAGCVGVNGEPLIDELKAEAAKQAPAAPEYDLLTEQRAAYYNGAYDTCMYHNLGVFVQAEGRPANNEELDAFAEVCDEFAWTVIDAIGVDRYNDEVPGEVAPQRDSVPSMPAYKCLDCQNA